MRCVDCGERSRGVMCAPCSAVAVRLVGGVAQRLVLLGVPVLVEEGL